MADGGHMKSEFAISDRRPTKRVATDVLGQ